MNQNDLAAAQYCSDTNMPQGVLSSFSHKVYEHAVIWVAGRPEGSQLCWIHQVSDSKVAAPTDSCYRELQACWPDPQTLLCCTMVLPVLPDSCSRCVPGCLKCHSIGANISDQQPVQGTRSHICCQALGSDYLGVKPLNVLAVAPHVGMIAYHYSSICSISLSICTVAAHL